MKRNEIRVLADEAYNVLESQYEAALDCAFLVLKNAPQDPESFLLMTELALEKMDFEQALAWIERGLIAEPHHEGLLLKKAAILIDGYEDIDEAFSILEKIEDGFHNKSPEDLENQFGKGLVVDVYLLLIDCYRLKENFNQALVYAKSSLAIAPEDETVKLALATAYFEIGDYEKALDLVDPVEKWKDQSDVYWLKAQISCSLGNFKEADEMFLQAFKLDKSRYHRPIRLDEASFASAFEQAILALPREIRTFITSNAVAIHQVVPWDLVKESKGTLSPEACITIEKLEGDNLPSEKIISIFQKNIENLATRKEEMRDLIASALLHELSKLAEPR